MRIGIDIEEWDRLNSLLQHPGGLDKVFTRGELALLENRRERFQLRTLAGRFAVKEAAVKALGTGFRQGITPTCIETLRGEAGEPVLHFHRGARELMQALGLTRRAVSISYSRKDVVALVVLT